ncbi:MAG: metal-dependent transcriptional regulator [Candidatus Dormibacteraeota bacterium]|nr:metal-dependent transcriptional regulator [Candidatus Dormibacteraeota bacterium]
MTSVPVSHGVPDAATGVEPSEVVGRYLEAIYYMEVEGERAWSARLADWLGVSRPTVTIGIRRMIRDGLVTVSDKKAIELTEPGRKRAAAIVRRHRIMERWLTDGLGLDWVSADEEAARLEHAVSDKVEQAVWEQLGRPSTCPHGNPIPGVSSLARGEERLSSAAVGERVRVTRISEVAEREAPVLLSYLGERGIVPRASIQVLERDSLGDTLRLLVQGHEFTIAIRVAEKVWAVKA